MSDKLDDVDTWAHGVCASFIRERDELRAEVERLRAALTRLRAALEPNAGRDSLSLREAREITEQALADHKE